MSRGSGPMSSGAPGAPGGRPPATVVSLRGFVAVALGDEGAPSARPCGQCGLGPARRLQDAQLIVVGEPRPGRLAAVRAGLVAPHLLHRANCPVVALPTS